jgi:undecaprenyl diphosphate synthase
MNKISEKKVNAIPNHVAVIMDGNRRWAADRGIPSWKGHEEGANMVKNIITEAVNLKIPYFSFWGSSLDNIIKRSPEEVSHLLEIFKNKFNEISEDKNIHDNQIKISVLGRWKEMLPSEVSGAMQKAIDSTKIHGRHFLNFFIAYSGVDEMESAIEKIAREAERNPGIKITAELIKSRLFTKDLPPVDYLIRTGSDGDPHFSTGFMMWDVADAQLYFSDKLWPDFTAEDFRAAIEEYGNRQRKFGA